MKKITSLFLCCLVVLIGISAAANALDYRIRALNLASLGTAGDPMGPSWANAIADSGCVAGLAYTDTSRTAVTNDQGDLALFDEGFALGVNGLGQAVGYAGRAAAWDAGGALSYLPLPTGASFSQARSINDSGRVVGECWLGTTQVRNYVIMWDPGLEPVNLGVGSGNGVNSSGWGAGSTRDANDNLRSFLWTPSLGMSQLAGGISSEGNALNDLGQVVGVVTDTSGTWACMWDIDGGMKLLDNIAGSFTSTAWAINRSGAIAGTCDTALGTYAVLWETDGSIINLGQLSGDVGGAAYALNNSGVVAGCSVDVNGTPRAVVWEVVPEPGGIVALFAGLVGLIPRLRRR